MLPFMLTEQERAQLACPEHLQHDPDCGVFGVRSFRAFSEQEARIQEELMTLIAAQLRGD